MRRLAVLVAVAALAGCGGSSSGTASKLTLALDFTPNAVHAPLYAAAGHGAFRIRQPGSGPDGLKLVASGKADLGVLDIHDLAIARERGTKVVAIGALVERPLAALVARGGRGILRPRDLEGRTVGVSGLPSDPAFVDAIVRHDGGDPRKVEQVTIGFSAVTRILSGRVLDTREFRVDDYGAPRYPEVVLITSERTLRTKRAALHDALLAIANGIQTVRADPQGSARQVAEAAGTKDVDLVRAQLDAVLPFYGTSLDRNVLARWAAFDARIGIVKAKPDVASAFDVDFGKDLGSTAS
jgi:putative hydroxymethylpyrimidine transport system substrate-binding protein